MPRNCNSNKPASLEATTELSRRLDETGFYLASLFVARGNVMADADTLAAAALISRHRRPNDTRHLQA